MQKASLPKFLTPLKSEFLVRCGRDYDGGYIVDSRDIKSADVLLSFGISDDWSFEKEFYGLSHIPVVAYDASTFPALKKKIKNSIIRLNPIKLVKALIRLVDYFLFFKSNRIHIRQFVGFDLPTNLVSMNSVIADLDKRFGAGSKIFLKIDIEGWEYRILEEICSISPRLTGLVVEFHDVDIHLEKIEHFTKMLTLGIAHVHANNFTPINHKGTPLTIECTFSSSLKNSNEIAPPLPHPLDMPNHSRKAEVRVFFE
jgi:hypothetical protein